MPLISKVPVAKDQTNVVINIEKNEMARIKGDNTEDTSSTEGKVLFDILFHAVSPVSGELITLIINVEAQRTYYTEYSLMKRAVYYVKEVAKQNKLI